MATDILSRKVNISNFFCLPSKNVCSKSKEFASLAGIFMSMKACRESHKGRHHWKQSDLFITLCRLKAVVPILFILGINVWKRAVAE